MSALPSLEIVLADAREEAAILRSHSHKAQADSMEKICDAVAAAMADYLALLTESEAMLYTGLKLPALRRRFTSLAARGLALWDGKRRLYRRCALEHRGNAEAAHEAGRRAARGAA
jgi:hypothetical protein